MYIVLETPQDMARKPDLDNSEPVTPKRANSMKALVICDECNPAEATAICRESGYGIEVQSFYDPKYLESKFLS